MLPFRKVVASTDFSAPSFEALDCAGELALHFGAELILVHAVLQMPALASANMSTQVNVPYSKYSLHEYMRQVEAEAKENLHSLVRERIPPEVGSRIAVFSGEPATEIVGCARNEQADVIVMSTHGRGGLQRLFMGSVAERVVRIAPCPVLTIRASGQQE